MVFLTVARFVRMNYRGPNKGPDEFYRKRNIFRLSAHFYGRARNCYSIAVRKVHRALVYSTKGRKLKREDMRDLWTTRTTAACEELGLPFPIFRQGLQSSDVLLNRKSLSNLAIWEPRTFKALTDFAWKRAEEEGVNGLSSLPSDPPSHVVTRDMLKKKKK
ncbi:39S ribosomal protein L20, mitochondrial [Macrosteles quadrilineatus]|uniref:39S ribosomal protein L20, mitochondrial n=1 Tax=Macrosteles quadrilineatus TaxID=74068 RepID=UPI0023E0DCF0|nr:39S ribosomal protein L20, mitochondrial [Macrosteles quadrilineatus]